MEESRIRDYKTEAVVLQEELEKCICGTEQEKYAEKLREIKAELEKSQPSLMFYGIYNAGKSTLLNAIFGGEVASVNDIPETHKVTLYKWGNYTLADTPGLNGPPEDEAVTAAEIRRHDVIMFVIDDSDNFDSDVITRKIIEILETGKPCIIVINTKNDSDDEKILAIKTKMNQNIQTLNPASQNIELVDVDAETALKAKKEAKKLLLEKSKIGDLEYHISSKLASVDSVRMLRVPIELVIDLCSEMQESLKNEVQDEDCRNLYQLKETLIQVMEQVRQEFATALNHMLDQFGEEIYRQASENRQWGIRENVYEQQIQELAQRCMDRFSEEGNLALRRFGEVCRMNLKLGDVPEAEQERSVPKVVNDKDDLDELLDVLEKLPPIPMPEPIPLPVIIGVVKVLKKWIFGSGNGKSPDVEEWNRQQEDYAQKRAMALRELKNQISMQMEDYRGRVSAFFMEQIETAYRESVAGVESALQEMEGKNQDRVQMLGQLAELAAKAERLLKDIQADKPEVI